MSPRYTLRLKVSTGVFILTLRAIVNVNTFFFFLIVSYSCLSFGITDQEVWMYLNLIISFSSLTET